MSSTYGQMLRVAIFGQSHAPGIGVTIDGLPAGLPIDLDALARFTARRAPGKQPYATTRREADLPEFLCGVVNGHTCGAPLTAIIRNTNTRSGDYSELRDKPRPAHADYTAQIKYGGWQDVAGGGHFSGRLTAPLCIAGGICLQLLQRLGISVAAHIAAVGEVQDRAFDPMGESPEVIARLNTADFAVIDAEAEQKMRACIENARARADSVGGIVECMVQGVPAGLGDPMFDGLENRLAHILFGIPAVKGVAFGNGFEAAALTGSQNNDAWCMQNGAVRTASNRHGGILGGISSGMPIVFRAAFKPTPSIGQEQQTVSLSEGCNTALTVHGRHDPCIVPRAVPCVEAAAAIALVDAWLCGGRSLEPDVYQNENGSELFGIK